MELSLLDNNATDNMHSQNTLITFSQAVNSAAPVSGVSSNLQPKVYKIPNSATQILMENNPNRVTYIFDIRNSPDELPIDNLLIKGNGGTVRFPLPNQNEEALTQYVHSYADPFQEVSILRSSKEEVTQFFGKDVDSYTTHNASSPLIEKEGDNYKHFDPKSNEALRLL
jgi:hypothetical protein